MTLDESRLRPVIRLLQKRALSLSWWEHHLLNEESWSLCGHEWRRYWHRPRWFKHLKPLHTHPIDMGLTAENLLRAFKRFGLPKSRTNLVWIIHGWEGDDREYRRRLNWEAPSWADQFPGLRKKIHTFKGAVSS